MIFSIFRVMKKYILPMLFLLCLLFGMTTSRTVDVLNVDRYSSSNISVQPISYGVDVVYNSNIMYGVEQVLSEGVIGYSVDDNVLVSPINEVREIGRGYKSISYGSTTGYGADCVGCSGNVACSTKYGSHNLIRDGIYYNDSTYGNARIIAADNSLYPCGTIMEIDNGILDPFMAIVLDTGSAMRNSWRNGDILIDIAFSYEDSKDIHSATNRSGNVSFKVYRTGW